MHHTVLLLDGWGSDFKFCVPEVIVKSPNNTSTVKRGKSGRTQCNESKLDEEIFEQFFVEKIDQKVNSQYKAQNSKTGKQNAS